MSDLTILYLTDNVLDPLIARRCRELLVESAKGKPIISVSQKPVKLGENVCMGDIGSSSVSIDVQMLAGLKKIKTKYVAVAEHDCVYAPEHFEFEPPDEEFFWYNLNCWLVQYLNVNFPEMDGVYSFMSGRKVQSQMICGTESLKDATEKKLEIKADPAWVKKYGGGRVGEPGTNYMGRSRRIARPREVKHLWGKLKRYIIEYNAKEWRSKAPNLDIRHGRNFTGPRRGHKRTFDLAPWGRFDELLGKPQEGETNLLLR